MSQHRVLALACAPLAAGAMLLASTVPAAASAAPRGAPTASQSASSLVAQVTGTVGGVAQTGTLTIDRFVRQAGQILAVGDLTLGGVNLGTVQIPVNLADTSGSCAILHLDLGPLDLNLLGLVVHLNEVVLDINAQSGPGNLLGNLLCAVAHLLDNNALGGVTAVLNDILRAL